MKTRPFNDFLHDQMRDPAFAIAYLSDALKEGPEQYLEALMEIEEANRSLAIPIDATQELRHDKAPATS